MKRNLIMAVFFLIAWAGLFVPASPALAFNSGSTGVDGAFAPTADTVVQLPANGVLNYTTVNIPTGVTVTFKGNAANTPVYILATGDVTIAGALSVSGLAGNALAPGWGGPGGFDGGVGGTQNACGGPGIGPGGGKAGVKVAASMSVGAGGGGGGYGAAGSNGGTWDGGYSTGGLGGSAYGNSAIIPMVGGSGGGGACAQDSNTLSGGGGGGGGALIIATPGTLNITGSVTANGGTGANYTGGNSGGGGGGGGGAIRLMADVIKGEGTISANGGSGGLGTLSCPWYCGYYANGGGGGAGRIRLEANTLLRTSVTNPSYTFGGAPVTVFPALSPALKIAKIGGIAVPASPTGDYRSPDVVLPSTITNPVSVNVEANNIPPGTTVTVMIVPELGATSSATAVLSGIDSLSTATAQVTLSGKTVNIIVATATYTLAAANIPPKYADGEKVVKMRVDSVLGGKSSITYITESDRELKSIM